MDSMLEVSSVRMKDDFLGYYLGKQQIYTILEEHNYWIKS